jgi:hypothetical protein
VPSYCQPQIWRSKSLYSIPPETTWLCQTSGTGLAFSSPSTTLMDVKENFQPLHTGTCS